MGSLGTVEEVFGRGHGWVGFGGGGVRVRVRHLGGFAGDSDEVDVVSGDEGGECGSEEDEAVEMWGVSVRLGLE